MSDDLSISYSTSELDQSSSRPNESDLGVGASYTSGGLTLSGTTLDQDTGGTNSDDKDQIKYELGVSFSF